MSALVRCPNPDCGHLSRVSHDPPGRVFRCPRCQSKLRGGMAVRADSKALLPPRRRQVLQGQSAAPSRAGSRSAGGWVADWPNDGRSPSLGNDSVLRATALATPDSASGLQFGFPGDLDGLLDSPSLEEPRLEDENPSWSAVLETDSARSSDVDSRLGRYRILGVLGEGQYARVYRGYDPILERAVALKVLRPGLLRLDKMRERFLGEARALARLRHPRIVPVFEVGCDADVYFIAMGLIEGESLAELRNRGASPLGVRRAVEIVADLAEALAHAHRQGIVHRDVKPLNIRLDQTGQVYLMDFGIAYRPDSGEVCVDGGKRTGTPAYVAPELARGGQPVILPASDQYSLGVVFYELLCGRPPFTGPPLYVLFQAANQQPPAPRAVDPTIPPRLAAICLKMLSKCPESRYPSCDDLSTSLRRWLKGTSRARKKAERAFMQSTHFSQPKTGAPSPTGAPLTIGTTKEIGNRSAFWTSISAGHDMIDCRRILGAQPRGHGLETSGRIGASQAS